MAVESEAEHIKKLIRDLILLPITFILFLFRKRTFADLIQPIRDLWDFFWDAKATAILILINVFVYIFILVLVSTNFLGIGDFKAFFHDYMEDGPKNLISLNFFPIVMNLFTHFSFSHLFGNMIFLFVFGRVVEKNIGSKKTILMYLATGIISGVFSDIINLADLAHFEYGASGAIMGLGMIALLLDPYAFTFFAIGIPTPIFIWVWVFMAGDIFSIILSEESSVAYFAHLGGYLSAIALSFFLLPEWRGNMKKNLVMSFMTILAIYFIWSFNVIPMILSYLGLSIA